MNLKVVVNRMQYGVGQGGFHCQQVAVQTDATDVHIEPYRFVYDCGSDTGPVSQGHIKPLEWAIRHYAGRLRVNSSKPKVTVNALYLSHFQKDHIDGAFRLTKLTDVKEIVIPHITHKQVAHIFAQQVSSGSFGSSVVVAERYLAVLQRAANGDGPIIGNVPTTRVPSSPGDVDDGLPNQQLPPEPEPDPDKQEVRQEWALEGFGDLLGKPFSWKRLQAGHYELTHSASAGLHWNHQTSRLLDLRLKTGIVDPVIKNLWELRVWSYAQSLALSDLVASELGKLEASPGVPALPKLLGGSVDGSEIAWAIKHRVKVQRAYKTALKAHGVKDAHDHNVVSLCLHSGPVATQMRVPRFQSWKGTYSLHSYHRLTHAELSWVGTGDAVLADASAWTDFNQHFTRGHDRIAEWLTVCIPHHGSGSGKNFNPDLLSKGMKFAVLSAGAFNKYCHPSRGVLEKVVSCGAKTVVVTELTRLGFSEQIVYQYESPGWSF